MQVESANGHKRTRRARRQVISLGLLRLGNAATVFALIPLSLEILGQDAYGIWLAISSALSWILIFDFGLNMGLRNRLTEAFATSNSSFARALVSTSYALSLIVAGCLAPFLIIGTRFIDWSTLLNSTAVPAATLHRLLTISVVLMLLHLVLKTIGTILLADQNPAGHAVFPLISNVVTIAVLSIMRAHLAHNIVGLGLIIMLSPVITYSLGSLLLFSTRLSSVRPSVSYISGTAAYSFWPLSAAFFVIQLSAITIFSADTLLISHLFGPMSVVNYQVAYRYMSIPSALFGVILAPLWSATTDAWVRKDTPWIRNTIRKSLKIWGGLVVLTLLLLLLSTIVYTAWMGPGINISLSLTAIVGCYHVTYMFTLVFLYFINGVGKLTVQLIYMLIAALLNIPLSIFLAVNMSLGMIGVIGATCLLQGGVAIWSPLQYARLMQEREHS